tara:strand:+ start:8496 stop:8621 length:126 start_codon:yes stop_codon:yes gene_type:complete
MESRVTKLFNRLEEETYPQEYKGLAKDYLARVMDIVKEYSI